MGKTINMNAFLQSPLMKETYEILKKTKRKLPHAVYVLLQEFIATGNENYLQQTTFRYIYIYKITGKKKERLNIALADFGLSIEELDSMELHEIISELMGR